MKNGVKNVYKNPWTSIPRDLSYDPTISPIAKTLYVILHQHGEDPDSCYPSLKRLCDLSGVSHPSVLKYLDLLEERGWIERFTRQKADGSADSNGYYVYDTPNTRLVTTLLGVGNEVTRGTKGGYQGVGNDVTTNKNHIIITNNNNVQNDEIIKDLFDEFWAVYPRKQGKKYAFECFKKALNEASAEVVIYAAESYKNDPNREDQYTKQPSTWLNQGCWEDEPLPKKFDKKIHVDVSSEYQRPEGYYE